MKSLSSSANGGHSTTSRREEKKKKKKNKERRHKKDKDKNKNKENKGSQDSSSPSITDAAKSHSITTAQTGTATATDAGPSNTLRFTGRLSPLPGKASNVFSQFATRSPHRSLSRAEEDLNHRITNFDPIQESTQHDRCITAIRMSSDCSHPFIGKGA